MRSARLIAGIQPGTPVTFEFNGEPVTGFAGEGLAAALMRAGIRATRTTRHHVEPRGYYCGMGVCWECAVEVDGLVVVRGCSYPVSDGLVARSPAVRSQGE